MADIHKIGLLAVRDGRMLLCRKKHTTDLLILPGGRLEADESAIACLHRELLEELGDTRVNEPEFVGTYEDEAASTQGSAPRTVRIDLFRGDLEGEPEPHAEIAELVWFGEDGDRSQLAPSLSRRIIPDLIRRGLLPWAP